MGNEVCRDSVTGVLLHEDVSVDGASAPEPRAASNPAPAPQQVSVLTAGSTSAAVALSGAVAAPESATAAVSGPPFAPGAVSTAASASAAVALSGAVGAPESATAAVSGPPFAPGVVSTAASASAAVALSGSVAAPGSATAGVSGPPFAPGAVSTAPLTATMPAASGAFTPASLNWDSASSTIKSVVRPEGFDDSAEESLIMEDPYEYPELYQGCHPNHRNDPQPHSIYPIAKVYELLSNSAPHKIFRLIWDISTFERLVEDIPQYAFQSLGQAIPKLLWLKDLYDPNKNNSLFPSVFSFSSSSTSSITATNTSRSNPLIDLTASSIVINHSIADSDVVAVDDESRGGGGGGSGGDGNSGDSGGSGYSDNSNTLSAHQQNLADDDGQYNSDDEIDVTELPPAERLKNEKSWFDDLKKLYTNPFKRPYVKVDIGGRGVMLNSFYYEEAENDFTFGKKSRRFEYVDIVDDTMLYRWEIKGCVARSLKFGKKYLDRVYFALCRYQPVDKSSTRMYDCLAIEITRCKDRDPLFLMKEVGGGNASKIECWTGWNLIKYFYAIPEVSIPVETLLKERHQYWKSMNYLYRPDQRYLLDTKSPGNRTQLDVSSEQMQRAEKYWSIKAGSKPVEDASIPKRIQDKKSATEGPDLPKLTEKERKKYQGDLTKANETIQALQRQLEKLKQQQKEDISKKSKATKKNEVAENAELAKMRAALLELRKENSSLKAEVVATNKRGRSPEPEPLHHRKKANISVESSSRVVEGNEELQYQENRRKAARVALEAAKIEQQALQVESEKVIQRNKQEQMDLFSLQRTQLLADKFLDRSDEDRKFQKQVALMELEHKFHREQNKDIMRMANTANDPVNLSQMLHHKRSVNTETLKSPVLQQMELIQRSSRLPSDSGDQKKSHTAVNRHHKTSSSSAVPNNNDSNLVVEGEELSAEGIDKMDAAALMRAIERENKKASNYRSQLAAYDSNSSGDDEETDD